MDEYTLQSSLRQMSSYLVKSLKQVSPKSVTEKTPSMQKEDEFLEKRIKTAKKEIAAIIEEFKRKKYQIIISNKDELVALAIFYSEMKDHKIRSYRVINQDERYLRDFPSDDTFCVDFYMAYCLASDEDMQEVYQKYIV